MTEESNLIVNAVIAVENVRENGNSGKQYKSKNAAGKEMKERIWKILVEKGHRENDEQVKWDIREE